MNLDLLLPLLAVTREQLSDAQAANSDAIVISEWETAIKLIEQAIAEKS